MNRSITAIFAQLMFALVASAAFAQVTTQDVQYKQGGTTLKGMVAFDAAQKGARPAIIIVHEWWGHNEHARNQARKYAAGGFVTFAIDMYGDGKVTTHPKDAGEFMNAVMKDPATMKARFEAAVDYLKTRPEVDATRIAAAGYCFGGSVALTMARAGADLKAVATFHAGLKPVQGEAQAANFHPKLLIQTGGADPMIPADQRAAFEKEMKAAGVSYELKVYPDARHAFTNPDADKAGMAPLKYDAAADTESFAKAMAFFKATLGK